jgi:hypothetical protein
MSKDKRCDDCIYFSKQSVKWVGKNYYDEPCCKRYPPKNTTDHTSLYANTRRGDWCGEFKAKQEQNNDR